LANPHLNEKAHRDLILITEALPRDEPPSSSGDISSMDGQPEGTGVA